VIARVLDGVKLDAGIAIELDLGLQTQDMPLALIGKDVIARDAIDIRFGLDPLGAAALNGGFSLPWSERAARSAKLAATLAAQGFTRAIAVADGRIVHDAGGTEAQELAYVLAAAVAYLRALEAGGISLDAARRMIFFRLAADADQFLTIAKFRTLRRLWQHVEQSCGLASQPIFVAAETAWRTMTRNDPYVNVLRATIAVFAAGVGGADAITVLPFTAARGLADAFARRVARNTQLVLLEEAGIARVADPAAGTGWSERLGSALCGAAWTLFQEIEFAGGAAAALECGLIQGKVAHARTVRERALAERRETLVGANEFPDISDVPVLDVAKAMTPFLPVKVPVEPLTPVRLAAAFEDGLES
jgi:methylmalonyl-CoA mutase